jgi:hypothetical protein
LGRSCRRLRVIPPALLAVAGGVGVFAVLASRGPQPGLAAVIAIGAVTAVLLIHKSARWRRSHRLARRPGGCHQADALVVESSMKQHAPGSLGTDS